MVWRPRRRECSSFPEQSGRADSHRGASLTAPRHRDRRFVAHWEPRRTATSVRGPQDRGHIGTRSLPTADRLAVASVSSHFRFHPLPTPPAGFEPATVGLEVRHMQRLCLVLRCSSSLRSAKFASESRSSAQISGQGFVLQARAPDQPSWRRGARVGLVATVRPVVAVGAQAGAVRMATLVGTSRVAVIRSPATRVVRIVDSTTNSRPAEPNARTARSRQLRDRGHGWRSGLFG